MFVEYRHVGYGEHFWSIDDGVHRKYIKRNHNRAQLVSERKGCTTLFEDRITFRRFKKNAHVLSSWTPTPENAWMEVPCKHEIVPFDNDKQCVHCGEEFKGEKK